MPEEVERTGDQMHSARTERAREAAAQREPLVVAKSYTLWTFGGGVGVQVYYLFGGGISLSSCSRLVHTVFVRWP